MIQPIGLDRRYRNGANLTGALLSVWGGSVLVAVTAADDLMSLRGFVGAAGFALVVLGLVRAGSEFAKPCRPVWTPTIARSDPAPRALRHPRTEPVREP